MPPPLPPLALHTWLRWAAVERALRTLPDVRTVLEVGAGQGAVSARLAARYDYLGVEPDPASYEVAAARLARLGRGTVRRAPVEALAGEASFDLVCAFEVLEHLEDDRAALDGWCRRVRPGGALLLSVPANPHRYGPWDELVGHIRRYRPEGLRQLLVEVGLTAPRTLTFGFPLGYALETARDAVARRRSYASAQEGTAASGRLLQPRPWMGRATQALTAPFRLAQRPFGGTSLGTGLVAWARRPA